MQSLIVQFMTLTELLYVIGFAIRALHNYVIINIENYSFKWIVFHLRNSLVIQLKVNQLVDVYIL